MRLTRAVRLGVLPAGIALGLAAEWATLHRPSFAVPATAQEQRLVLGDFVVGASLLVSGELCRRRRPQSHIGLLLIAAGFAWFLGSFASSSFDSVAGAGAVFVALHRGPLVHAVLSYPNGWLRDRLERVVVAAAYAASVVAEVGQSAGARLALAGLLGAAATRAYAHSSGPFRRARLTALAAALALAGALAAAGVADGLGAGGATDRALLWTYQAVIVAIALGVALDLVRSRWAEATLTSVVIDLGAAPEEGVSRKRLARALRDSSLTLGYWLDEEHGFVDERGRRITLPEADSGTQATVVREGEQPLAVLVHDPGALDDPRLRDSVIAALRLAVANARLQRETRRQAEELSRSRRRLVEAADVERRRLEHELRDRTEARLAHLERLLAGAEADGADAALLAETLDELTAARADLAELAQGIHPRLLGERGLAAALADLARRAPVPVELRVPQERYPARVEAPVYFVCSEGLANIGKHADATRASIEMTRADGHLRVVVRDDGAGGADLAAGSGLRGLADRVEALGGRFELSSVASEGTTLVAELPLDEATVRSAATGAPG
jgi:signal transduction histidine kinase